MEKEKKDDYTPRDLKEWLLFTGMCVFGAPFTWVILGLLWGWWAFGTCLVLFYASYKGWKWYSKMEGKLRIAPNMSFGGKDLIKYNEKS